MKGGFNNPPNCGGGHDLAQNWQASMKGGFNNPPNHLSRPKSPSEPLASMKGGFNNPPNVALPCRFRAGLARLQ